MGLGILGAFFFLVGGWDWRLKKFSCSSKIFGTITWGCQEQEGLGHVGSLG